MLLILSQQVKTERLKQNSPMQAAVVAVEITRQNCNTKCSRNMKFDKSNQKECFSNTFVGKLQLPRYKERRLYSCP